MDAIDILGGLLGRKANQGGRGGSVLKEIFRRRSQPTADSSSPPSKHDIERQAEELEVMLNVAKGRTNNGFADRSNHDRSELPQPRFQPSGPAANNNEHALVLAKAMLNAAKSDGRLDQEEEEKILQELQNPSPEAIQLLQAELRRPVDIPSFVATIPLGMEQQVYMISLIAIDLDTQAEARYLADLGDSLRIPLDVRRQIHDRLGAPNPR